MTSETRSGDHDTPIAAATVDDEHQEPNVEVDVYVSPIDGAAVVHVSISSDEAPVRVTVNDGTVFTTCE